MKQKEEKVLELLETSQLPSYRKEDISCLSKVTKEFLPYMNERDGLGRLIDVEPSFRLKKSHSFSIMKALRTKKLNETRQNLDINDKIVVQDHERSIHLGCFERSKIMSHPLEYNMSVFDNSNWSERNLLPY